jgi:hypothetical protein
MNADVVGEAIGGAFSCISRLITVVLAALRGMSYLNPIIVVGEAIGGAFSCISHLITLVVAALHGMSTLILFPQLSRLLH